MSEHIQFSEFAAVAEDQGIIFDDEFAMVLYSAEDLAEDMPEAWDPSFEYDTRLELAAPIIQAGRWLMTRAAPPFASVAPHFASYGPFRGEASWDSNPAASTLRSLVNQSLVHTNKPLYPTGFLAGTRTIDVCDKAEGYFVQAADCLKNNADDTLGPLAIGVRLFVDKNNVPAIMQKMGSTPEGKIQSGLTIREITINSIVYPAGSLLCLDLIEGFYPADKIDVVSKGCVERASFLRLSSLSPGFTGQQNPHLDAMITAADQAVARASWQNSVALTAAA